MADRSSRIEVRNPIVAIPEFQLLLAEPPALRLKWATLFRAYARYAAEKAELSWRTAKPPMAAYWGASKVIAKHLAAALRRGIVETPENVAMAVITRLQDELDRKNARIADLERQLADARRGRAGRGDGERLAA